MCILSKDQNQTRGQMTSKKYLKKDRRSVADLRQDSLNGGCDASGLYSLVSMLPM